MKYIKEYDNYGDLEKDIDIYKDQDKWKKKELSPDKKIEDQDEEENEKDEMNESVDPFDIEFVITKIMEKFPEEEATSMFDNEILEWVDSDWADDYESEYDWYIDHNNGEAQDVVIDQLVDWYTTEYDEISSDNKSELIDRIKEEYSDLNYF